MLSLPAVSDDLLECDIGVCRPARCWVKPRHRSGNPLSATMGKSVKRLLVKMSTNGQDGPVKAAPPSGLPPGTLRYLSASLKQQWKRYRKGLKRCQVKFSERAVHESRVETRRLLSILALLDPFLIRGRSQKAQIALKRHLDTFDDLRDTQVQLAAVRKMLRALPVARPFYEYLLGRQERSTRETRKRIKRIKAKRLGKLIAACRQDMRNWSANARPGRANAMLLRSIARAFGGTVKLRNRINPHDTETIHRTRVAFKRFRYMIETLADHLPIANNRRLASMHRYQTMMGEIQDAEVLRQSTDGFLEKKKLNPIAARRLRRELSARRQRLIRVYLDAADQLLEFWPEAKRTQTRRRRATLPAKLGERLIPHSPAHASPKPKATSR